MTRGESVSPGSGAFVAQVVPLLLERSFVAQAGRLPVGPTQDGVAIGDERRLVDGGMVLRIVSALVFDSATNASMAQNSQIAMEALGMWPLLPAPRSCLAR